MSFRQDLFRQEAIAHQGQPEPLDGLLRVTAPHEWMILAALGLAVVGVAGWALLDTVERNFAGPCALTLTGERHPVVQGVAGSVLEVLAREGDPVEAGEPIARLRLRELDHVVSVARARVELIEMQAQAGEDAFVDVLSAARAELLDLEARRETRGHIVSPYAGEITAQRLVLDQEVPRGAQVAMIRTQRERQFEAITLISAEDAPGLAVGMEARVIYPSHDRAGSGVLEAEVAHVSPRPVLSSGWLTSLGLEEPAGGGHLMRLALSEPTPPTVSDGDSCRLRVILSKEASLSLLRSPPAPGLNR